MTLFTRLRLFMVPGAGPESSLIACSWHALFSILNHLFCPFLFLNSQNRAKA
uniref:Uncharacterized protein n=1 Tax=Anguilla anguilla TaxID=7936 RepID=A0A0E9SLX4_ANGAN